MFIRLIHKMCSAIASWTAPKQEALVLVSTYVHNGTFTRRGPGYEYACNCGQHYILAADEKDRTALRQCGACGKPFNLLRSLDAIDADGALLKVTPQEVTQRLDSLAIRQLAPQEPRVPFLPVEWGSSAAGEVIWTGEKPASGVQWK